MLFKTPESNAFGAPVPFGKSISENEFAPEMLGLGTNVHV